MMNMKRLVSYIVLAAAAVTAAVGCAETHTVYSDAEYIMFSDTASLHMIQEGARTFTVPVASTVACDYDRTVGVEILDSKSSAVEGLHYTLASNTVTIKAGERVARMEVTGNYEALEESDTVNIALRLVIPESVKWDLYGDMTNVKLLKAGTWSADKFTGWCVVTSSFLYTYPGNNTSMQRLIYTEQHPTEENTVILHSFLYDGYDVSIRFKTDDTDKPHVTMDEDQELGNSREIFYTVHGDGHVLVKSSPYYISYFNALSNYVMLYIYVHVTDLGDEYGVVDPYSLNALEWVSDEEADRLEREEGLFKSPF